MPAKMISEMPLPMPRSVMRSPSHMMKAVPAVSVITVMKVNHSAVVGDDHVVDLHAAAAGDRRAAQRGQPAGDADALDDREDDAAVAGVLVQLLPAGRAFLLQPLQGRHHHRQELHDDGRRDVRHDAQRRRWTSGPARRRRTG